MYKLSTVYALFSVEVRLLFEKKETVSYMSNEHTPCGLLYVRGASSHGYRIS
jgi:hypothetical protein